MSPYYFERICLQKWWSIASEAGTETHISYGSLAMDEATCNMDGATKKLHGEVQEARSWRSNQSLPKAWDGATRELQVSSPQD